jgi:ribosomal protein L14E/L6E/L27E
MDETGRLNEIQEIKDGRNKGQKCYIIRYIEDDKMVTLMKTNNVEAKRVFVRVK